MNGLRCCWVEFFVTAGILNPEKLYGNWCILDDSQASFRSCSRKGGRLQTLVSVKGRTGSPARNEICRTHRNRYPSHARRRRDNLLHRGQRIGTRRREGDQSQTGNNAYDTTGKCAQLHSRRIRATTISSHLRREPRSLVHASPPYP